MDTHINRTPHEDPSSERWLQYYSEAKARRRARPRAERTRVRLKRWRNRQRALLVGGFVTIGLLSAIFYFVFGG
ncbi:MAG TPA: hypothetical protein VHJ20_09380 [Polyangia bacterium]|nr:hypothetical protein [Polyangia bacterium]